MYSNLSNFVKQKRKEAHLTQEEFAERAGVALTVVRKRTRKRKFEFGKSKSDSFDVW